MDVQVRSTIGCSWQPGVPGPLMPEGVDPDSAGYSLYPIWQRQPVLVISGIRRNDTLHVKESAGEDRCAPPARWSRHPHRTPPVGGVDAVNHFYVRVQAQPA